MVSGHVQGLAQGERDLGIASSTLNLYGNQYGFEADINLGLEKRGKLGKLVGHLEALAKYRNGYDVYHFNYGSTLLHFAKYNISHLDIGLFSKDAVKIFTYQGCDARQKYPTMERLKIQGNSFAACFEKDCYDGACNSGRLDLWRRRSIEKVDEYADHIYAQNPDLLYFLPPEKSSFLPYCIADEGLLRSKEDFFEGGKVRIAHAPTQRAVKGTSYILKALEKLADEFPGVVEVDLIEGVSRKELLRRLAKADLFVDQVLVGWYGVVSVEALFLGVPTAVFINDDHLQFIPEEMVKGLPFIRIDKQSIYEKLRAYVRQREQAEGLKRVGLEYAHAWHSRKNVAQLTVSHYRKCLKEKQL